MKTTYADHIFNGKPVTFTSCDKRVSLGVSGFLPPIEIVYDRMYEGIHYAIWRKKSSQYWAGIGCNRGYSEVEYWLVKIYWHKEDYEKNGHYYAELVESTYPRKRAKVIRAELEQKVRDFVYGPGVK